MNYSEVKQVLEKLNVSLDGNKITTSKGTEWLTIRCPFAKQFHANGTDRNPSFGISLGDVSSFNCFSCGTKGGLKYLVRLVSELNQYDLSDLYEYVKKNNRPTVASILGKKSKVKPEMLQLSERAIDLWRPATEYTEAIHYLATRYINEETADVFDLRFDAHNERIVFPVRTRGLNGASGRSIYEKNYHNYFGFSKNSCLGGYDKLTDNTKIAVVEGFFDLIRCHGAASKLGYDVVCTFGCDVSDTQMELIQNTDKKLSCWFDQDFAGQKGWRRLLEMKVTYGMERLRWASKLGDLGGMTDDLLEKVLQ